MHVNHNPYKSLDASHKKEEHRSIAGLLSTLNPIMCIETRFSGHHPVSLNNSPFAMKLYKRDRTHHCYIQLPPSDHAVNDLCNLLIYMSVNYILHITKS